MSDSISNTFARPTLSRGLRARTDDTVSHGERATLLWFRPSFAAPRDDAEARAICAAVQACEQHKLAAREA